VVVSARGEMGAVASGERADSREDDEVASGEDALRGLEFSDIDEPAEVIRMQPLLWRGGGGSDVL